MKSQKTMTEQDADRFDPEENSSGQPALSNDLATVRKGRKKPQLILPSSSIEFIETAEICFRELAKTKTYFMKGELVVEVLSSDGATHLSELGPTEFQSRLEESFTLMRWIVLPGGGVALKPSRCSAEAAKVLLKTRQKKLLPPIQVITSAPLFVEGLEGIEVLNKGYHDSMGGTLITEHHHITEIPLEEAVSSLLSLLDDFLFVDASDKSRALASMISPSLRLGGLLDCDFPLDVAEAEESQTGKTYRLKINALIYGEEPHIINKKNAREGGVGSFDESVSTALLSGQPFLMLENIRDKVDSQILESALRGTGRVQARMSYSKAQQVKTTRIVWMYSSNKSETTRDLANRSIITRLQKQPASFVYKKFPEGDLENHVSANSDYYLSCILSVLRDWYTRGKPRTNDNSHDFREWCQSLDWIIQNIFKLSPLLDGHRAEQDRISDSSINWLRELAIHIKRDDRLDEKFRPGELADICSDHGIEIPGTRAGCASDQLVMQTGKTLKRLFRETNKRVVGGMIVEHSTTEEYNEIRQQNKTVNLYEFTLPSEIVTF